MLDEILDKIDEVIRDYKNDHDLKSGERTWAVCALTEVKMFVKSLKGQ